MEYDYFAVGGDLEEEIIFKNYKEATKKIKENKWSTILYKYDLECDTIVEGYEKKFEKGKLIK